MPCTAFETSTDRRRALLGLVQIRTRQHAQHYGRVHIDVEFHDPHRRCLTHKLVRHRTALDYTSNTNHCIDMVPLGINHTRRDKGQLVVPVT